MKKINRILKLIISILFFIIYKIVVTIHLVFKNSFPSTMVIITYHSVKREKAAKFARQMDMLVASENPVRLEAALPAADDKNYIAVTFDDGYQSVIQNALPVLQSRKIPATIFVTTGSLGKRPGWISDPTNPYADEIVLTKEQLKELPQDIITIGSHTVSHIKLKNIGEDIVKREINDSKKILERLLHKKVTLISAPYATFDEKFTNLFREAGYQRVFLNIPTYPATKTDLYVMGRTSVEPDDWRLEFHLKLAGAYQWLPLAIRIKNTLLRRNGV